MRTACNPNAVSDRRPTTKSEIALPNRAMDACRSFPLSFGQQRLWFLDQLEPNSPLYNVLTLAQISGPLDVTVLKRSLNALAARHQMLRATIVCTGETPSQTIAENPSVQFRQVDLTTCDAADARARELVRQEIGIRFNLGSSPSLWRILILKLSAEEHLMVVTMHHIISDEWSLKIFFRELSEFYAAFLENRSTALPPLSLQYIDFAVSQRDSLKGEILQKQLTYWKEQLQGNPAAPELMTDYPRSLAPTFHGRNIGYPLNKQLTDSLRKLAKSEGVTLFMLLLAAYKALVYRYTQQEDLIIASPISGRNQLEHEELLGFFVNTLLLRTRVNGDSKFRELLKRVREITLGAYEHQDLPFEKLVDELKPERNLSHLPFTQLMFAVHQNPADELQLGQARIRFLDVESETSTSKFELTIIIREIAGGLTIRAEYNSDLFQRDTVERFLQHYENLLGGVVANPDLRIADLPLLSDTERRQLLVEWNRTITDYPRDKTVHELFEAQVERSPESIAVRFGAQSLTYRELNARANQLAHFLKRFKVAADVPVAICLGRSLEVIVAMLAVLKAGGAYVPLDAVCPNERLQFMLADSQAPVLLTQQPMLGRLPRNIARVVCLDTDWELIARESRENLSNCVTSAALAYIMYTSGSSGRPKGVAVPHRAITRLVLNTNYVQLSSIDRLAQISNVSFDAATFEIYGALLNGGQLIGITTDVALSPREFAQEIRKHGITGMFLTAALFNQLAAEVPGVFSGIRTVIAGGEALDPKWIRAVLKQGPPQLLLNGYGPTENTTFSCCHLIADLADDATNVPVGRPISNTSVYLLDQHLNPLPIGAAGDLYVGGDGLARGYWQQPQLTAEKFVPNPFRKFELDNQLRVSEFIYKTGDIARYLPDGKIEFLGRRDSQVKIRGFRVELGEIEVSLNQYPGIRECAVAVSNSSEPKRLLAYFVTDGNSTPNPADLRQFLSAKLPQHMVPSLFVRLPALPLTTNGKINRAALPEPGRSRPELEKKYVSPRDAVELGLARIWEDLLGVHPIGIEDRFFDLGGNSLLAVRVISQIEKVFGRKLRVAAVFQAPTIQQMAVLLRENQRDSNISATVSSVVEIQSQGNRTPLFLVHGAGGGMFWGYVSLSQHLGNAQPVYGFRSRGLDDRSEFERIEDMAAQYLADMRSIQPHGPYQLGGYCFGGNVAYEMAHQLSVQGEKVSLLALFNCTPPNSSYSRAAYTPIWFARLLRNLLYWANCCRKWNRDQRRGFFRWKLAMFRKTLRALTGVKPEQARRLAIENMVDLSSFSAEQQKLWEAHIRAQFDYYPKRFPGRVHLFRSPGHPFWCSFDPNYGWGDFAEDGVEVCVLPAPHERVLEEPFVQMLAHKIQKLLLPEASPVMSSSVQSGPRQTGANVSSQDAPAPASLSFAQKRSWLLYQLEHGNAVYHHMAVMPFIGAADFQTLQQALNEIARRHPILRTIFPSEDGRPAPKLTSGQIPLQRLDISRRLSDGLLLDRAKTQLSPDLSPLNNNHGILEIAAEQRQLPFDLTRDIPIRAALLSSNHDQSLLLLVIHEIAADAHSLSLLLREVSQIYEALRVGKALPLPNLGRSYSDFIALQHHKSETGEWVPHLAYWQKQLLGAPALLELPTDYPRPAQQTYHTNTELSPLSATLARQIKDFSDKHGIETFELLLITLGILLKRYTRQEDTIIATFVDGRESPEFAQSIGNFSNLVLLRMDLSGDPEFFELLRRARQTIAAAMDHSALPFERLLHELRPAREQSYHPLAQVAFNCRNQSQILPGHNSVPLTSIETGTAATKFDLSLQFVETSSSDILRADYATSLFAPERIRRFLAHWQRLLEEIAKNPDRHISKLPMLTRDEERTLLVEWTDTHRDYPKEKTLIQLFSEQAARTPDAVALVSGNTRLTYRELRDRAMLVSQRLRTLGVASETLVGICLERSWEMVAVILGTLQAGAAYVPLDPNYPKDRLAFIARDASLRVLVTQRKLLGSVPDSAAEICCIEDFEWQQACTTRDVANQTVFGDFCPPMPDTKADASLPDASDLAYVIYTSGSTGKPKGVAIEHRSAVALVCWARHVFSPEDLDGVLASTSICFDLSIFELFVPLSWGGKVILAENALALPALPAVDEVRLVNTVPSAIRELLRARGVPPSVRVINLAGEPLPSSLVEEIYAGTSVQRVYDLYGPTETTTYSTFTLRKPGQPPDIGRPLANEEIYLLDAHRKLVPIGVPGEVYIGGDGLARGYLNSPALTEEKFIPHQFRSSGRLYKTGDLARWRVDGNLEFLGRIDHQVKIRGFRIELGEIEAALKKQSGVTDAVVLAREDASGDRQLVSYVVLARQEVRRDITENSPAATLSSSDSSRKDRGASDGERADIEQSIFHKPISDSNSGDLPAADDLRRGLRQLLPEYMVPAFFVFLDALPLTPNGKVDRKALPAPCVDASCQHELAPPGTDQEKQLADIWRDVLHLDKVGINHNFFDMGGHSLLAFQVISRMRDAFSVEVPLSSFFETPTIAALAKGLVEGRWCSAPIAYPPPKPYSREGTLPASFVQERLWFLDQLIPGSHAYNVPLALRLKGSLDLSALQQAFNEVIRRHESLRTTFRCIDGSVIQVVKPALELEIQQRTVPEENLAKFLDQEAQRSFDLARGPLIRTMLVRIAENEHALLVVMHHTISDGWSFALLFQELAASYKTFCSEAATPQFPQPPLQYPDFACWQRECMQGQLLDRELNYWKQVLEGAPARLELPIDKPEPLEPSARAARRRLQIPRELSKEIATSPRGTPFIFLLSALALTLHKWTTQKDIVIGTVVAGRNQRQFENIIGCFMNFLPLRLKFAGSETNEELVSNVRVAVLEAQAHQDCPFEKIVEAVNPQRSSNQNPLYNIGLLLQNFPAQVFQTDKLHSSRIPINLEAALLDLRFEAEQTDETFFVDCEYKTELFDEVTIDQLLDSFSGVLHSLVRNPASKLTEVRLTKALEQRSASALKPKQEQVIAFASSFTAEPIEESVRYWMKELEMPVQIHFAPYNQVFQQLLAPDSVLAKNQRGLNVLLLRLEDWQSEPPKDSNQPLGTDNLQRSVNELVLALKAATMRCSTPYLVCICPPSEKVTAAPQRAKDLVRIERALHAQLENISGVYVVRPEDIWRWYPVTDYYERLADDIGRVPYTPQFFTALGTVIARKFHALNRSPFKVIVLDCDQTLWGGVCGEDGPSGIVLDAPRRALQQFMRDQQGTGKLLCLCSKNNEQDVLDVFRTRSDFPLRQEHFAAWQLNWRSKPENIRSLARELSLGLESFIFLDDNPVECAAVKSECPEVLTLQLPEDPDVIPQFLNHCWAFDQIKVTAEDLNRTDMYQQNRRRERFFEQSVSFGDFLAGLELKVNIAPLASEHLPRVAQLTQRTNQFNFTTLRRTEREIQLLQGSHDVRTVTVNDRFGDYGLVGLMIYRQQRGALDVDTFLLSCRVLGRGVEHRMLARLGEIAQERKLGWLDVHFTLSVKNKPALDFLESVGSAFRQPLNGGYLFRFPTGVAAGVVFEPRCPQAQHELNPASFKQSDIKVSSELRKFERYGELALEASTVAKIHQAVEAKSLLRSVRMNGCVPPRTALERSLCELWQKLLRLQTVGIRNNFFELGGHSLLAVRLFSEIEKLTGRKLPLVTVFQAPTIEQLAALLKPSASDDSPSLLVPIQPQGTRPPLFLVHGAGGDVLWGYANLAAHLPPDQPLYGIKSRGQAGLPELTSLKEMAACYLEQVRTFQPTGPYYLGGYCLGGNVAYEMARQLHADGEEVALVALLDSAPSNAGYESISWWRPGYGLRFARNLYYWLNDFSALTPEVRFRFVIRKSRALLRKLLRFHKGPSSETAVDLEDVIDPKFFPDNELARWQVHLRALVDHIEQPYSGCVTLFRTRGQPLFCSLEEDFCWSRLAEGGVEIKRIPGSHESIFIEPNVQILAASLGACLDALKSGRHIPKMKSQIGDQIPVSGDIEALIPD